MLYTLQATVPVSLFDGLSQQENNAPVRFELVVRDASMHQLRPATPAAAGKWYAALPPIDLETTELVVEAPGEGPGNWAGAPGITFDPLGARWLLTWRERSAERRGHTFHLAESEDGLYFTEIWACTASDFESASIEKGSLLYCPDGLYRLYLSYECPTGGWQIDVLEAERPELLDPYTRHEILTPKSLGTGHVKDPFVLNIGGQYCLYADFGEGYEATGFASSPNGRDFHWHGQVLAPGEGWDSLSARATCVCRMQGLWLMFYDGARAREEVREEKAGLAISWDMFNWHKLSTQSHFYASPFATGSLRYLECVPFERDSYWLYFEAARADGAHELRRATFSAYFEG